MKLILLHHAFSKNTPKNTFYTLKPDTALLRNNNTFFIPDFSNHIHYQLFLLLKISKMGKCISPRFAYRYYEELGLAVNFTALDILNDCIEKKIPLEPAYVFDNSIAISPNFLLKKNLPVPFELHLEENGTTSQKASTNELVKDIDECIANISQHITLKIGDYLLLGLCEENGPVKKDTRLKGFLNGELLLDFNVQ